MILTRDEANEIIRTFYHIVAGMLLFLLFISGGTEPPALAAVTAIISGRWMFEEVSHWEILPARGRVAMKIGGLLLLAGLLPLAAIQMVIG